MPSKAFNIVPAPTSTYLVLGGILLLMLIPFVALCYDSHRVYKILGKINVHVWIELAGMVLIAGVAILFLFFASSAKNAKFILSEQGLEIKSFIYGRTLPREVFNSATVLKLDLRNQHTYAPVIRTNGIGLPGYQAGWFSLANKGKALLFVTDTSSIVYLPTSKGYSVMLSVAEPEGFMDAAKELWKK